ncbi:sensor histidine kinase [Sphaerisporangium corydalis]|uniref:histidine kinase n=1 Tax=Sphaerisporangium corydalis TaxID=1441875 RepID=A0ABV9E8W5_9ACTN|nr:histidine kinase [Sphaerisporangium corydalis]
MTYAEVTTPWDRLRVHWSARSWLRTFHVATGVPIALLSVAVIAGLTFVALVLAWTLVVPAIALPLLFWSVPRLTRLQRARFAAFLDVDIPPVPAPSGDGDLFRRLIRPARARSTWRQIAYHLLAPLISAAGLLTVLVAWSAFLVTAALAVQMWAVGGGWRGALPAVVALALSVAAPALARGIAALDVIAAEALLGPSLSEQLAQRVETLQESRADVIDAADAERRRIERDLHDGAQQRLVSLAMNLGMARASLSGPPSPLQEVIVRSHEEAKQALKELRDLVRGLHPAVLTDEGLDAALSGLATRSPLPVRLRVEVPGRVSPTIEAVAFFVVSEALANVAKHSGASGAEVLAWREGDVLRLEVVDDGLGGAEPGGGTGLRGLAQRVGSVDGTLGVDSPPGGPTRISVELPCA